MRFIPAAYREGCERIAPWFAEKTAARRELDAAIRDRPNPHLQALEDRQPRASPSKTP
jgi:hypothetical protein